MLLRRRGARLLQRGRRVAAGLAARRRRADPQARAGAGGRPVRPRRPRRHPHGGRPGVRRARDRDAAGARGRDGSVGGLTTLRSGVGGARHVQRAVGRGGCTSSCRLSCAPSRDDRAAGGPQLLGDRRARAARRARGGGGALPIDDEKLEVRPLVRDEVLYVSAVPERARAPGHDRARSPRRRWSSTTPSPRTPTRSAGSSPSARRRTACGCAHGWRWS